VSQVLDAHGAVFHVHRNPIETKAGNLFSDQGFGDKEPCSNAWFAGFETPFDMIDSHP
jgi:hypothetical protein